MLNTLMMGVIAAAGLTETGTLISLTVGRYTVPKYGIQFAGFSSGQSALVPAMGSRTPAALDGITIDQITVQGNPTGVVTFLVYMRGNQAGRTLRAVPQNYGSELPSVAGTYDSGFNYTSFNWTLPNVNLFDNWTAGASRTCILEWTS